MIERVWGSVGWVLKAILVAAGSAVLLAKSVKYVHQGELGLRHLRGRVRCDARPITPGWASHVPFVGGLLKKSALPQTWPQGVLVPKAGRTWDANYSITFVINPALLYRSWFGHQDPDEYLRTACTSWLWQTLKTADTTPDRVDHTEGAAPVDRGNHRIPTRHRDPRHRPDTGVATASIAAGWHHGA